MLKNQLFGVEVEMTGITREKAARLVAGVLGTTPSHPESNCYHTRTIADQAARKWKIMRDSSITPIRNDDTSEPLDEYRVEFVTPPLNYSDIELLQNIIRKLRENGAKAHSSCGIHIHVDGANHTAVSLRRLVNFMTARQDLIYEALQIGDRESSWCHKLNKTLLDAMKKDKNLTKEKAEEVWYSRANDGYCGGIDHQHYNSTRYHGVNLHSFFTKGTVEFRLFNSTLHAGKIKAYIQFCLAVSAWAITSQEKIVFHSMDGYTPEQKVTIMRNILTHRLGLYGDEFKTCRLHLMTPLKKAAGMTCRAA
ncbi:Putative amidoligase enzyme [uncultured Blautia sp.]|uniref:amidoligase family protein n=1 Tax=Blautia acetigignens TaxID=2981783 RepID=UPI0008218280|nr:amidoligase family protein [Blautia acetigignens]MCU6776538.1 amidoligase family protein [Blautia acetigignens]SCI14908.1 Putative amidoligase enzyme [uncultured Blautia sp.]